jgi:hypothetical protein
LRRRLERDAHNTRHRSTIVAAIQYGANLALEVRELVLDNVPDDPCIDSEVVVDENVAQTRDLAPLNVGLLFRHFFGKLLDCFANDFEVSHDGIKPKLIRGKTFLVEVDDVYVDSPDRLKDILEIDPNFSSR